MIPNAYPGKLFAFEGMDGCGKTMQLEMTDDWLRNLKQNPRHNFVVKREKEPGKERFWGGRIYQELNTPGGLHTTNPYGFQAWYARDCKDHMPNTIRNLGVGSIVLMDRYRLSMVFGIPPQLSSPDAKIKALDELMKLNQAIVGEHFIWPDASLIFDVPVEIAIARLKIKFEKAGRGTFDEYEKAGKLEIVRSNYQLFAGTYPNCHIVPADGTPEEVFEKVKLIIEPIVWQIPSSY